MQVGDHNQNRRIIQLVDPLETMCMLGRAWLDFKHSEV